MHNKFTPAPWIIENPPLDADNITIFQPRGNMRFGICEVLDKDHEQTDANARLISSAPELLAECLRAQDELASAIRDGAKHFTPGMLQKWFAGVSAVIDKATGSV